MTRKRWQQALDLFEQSLPLPLTEREQFLRSIGERDLWVQQTVEELLAAHRSTASSDFLESPACSYQPIESNPQALIGHRIGPYRLTKYLAKGGMGVVYLADRADKAFRRQVAVKLISADPGLRLYNRFRREVQILADLNHPNLVTLYDAGRLGDGRPYLVMEYVEGENLRDWAKRRGAIPTVTVVEIIKQSSAGLHAAHEAGVIHRDVKPANIAITEKDGKLIIKVLDFGVAARKQHDGSGVTTTHGAIGTLLYMSPEQLQSTKGEDLTPASDVYALGLITYELLTGRPANDGQSQAEIITKHLYETPPAPSQVSRLTADISAELDRVVMKALAKDAKDRYPSAASFAQAVEAAYHKTPAKTSNHTPTKVISYAAPHPPTLPLHPDSPPPIPIARSSANKPMSLAKSAWVAAAVAVIAAIAIGAYRFWPVTPASGNPKLPTQALPTQVPPTQAIAGLRINLGIKTPEGQTFDGCRFALFKPEVTTRPAAISPDNALVILDEVNSQDKKSKIIKETPVPPGSYLASLECKGFKPFAEQVDITENPERPGWATVPLRLDPK
ncbi:MAG: serine/threonine-protein kinase [Acidobacteriota bacterium]